MGSTSTGLFHDREGLVEALDLLAEEGVPPDAIEVVLVDDGGFHRRKVRVRRGAGALRGMSSGFLAGVVVGAPVFALSAGGQAGAGTEQLPTLVDAALRGAALGGAVGLPLGAALGLFRAQRTVALSDEDWEGGAVVVTVRSREWAETARSVLARAGAARVSGDRLHE